MSNHPAGAALRRPAPLLARRRALRRPAHTCGWRSGSRAGRRPPHAALSPVGVCNGYASGMGGPTPLPGADNDSKAPAMLLLRQQSANDVAAEAGWALLPPKAVLFP